MTHIKVDKRWYHLESLTDNDKIRLGILKKDSKKDEFDEKAILEELKETSINVKKSLVQNKNKKKVTKD